MSEIQDYLDTILDENVEPEQYKHEPSKPADESVLAQRLSKVEVLVHASQLSKVMTGNFGLSEVQKKNLDDLIDKQDGKVLHKTTKKPLVMTATDKKNLASLVDKRDNPDIGETGKSYLDEMITSDWYGMHKNIHSKYTNHGNVCEQYSIDMINAHLGTNWEKNEETKRSSEWLLVGTPDVILVDAVIDIKNPYDTHTFDKKRNITISERKALNDKIDKEQKEYFWQMQSYMQLFDKPVAYLVYTLNEHYYMEDQSYYQQFGIFDRVIINKVVRDKSAMARYKERIPVIKKCIQERILKRASSITETILLMDELKTLN